MVSTRCYAISDTLATASRPRSMTDANSACGWHDKQDVCSSFFFGYYFLHNVSFLSTDQMNSFSKESFGVDCIRLFLVRFYFFHPKDQRLLFSCRRWLSSWINVVDDRMFNEASESHRISNYSDKLVGFICTPAITIKRAREATLFTNPLHFCFLTVSFFFIYCMYK